MNHNTPENWASLRAFVKEDDQPTELLELVELLQSTGARLPTSAVVCEDGDLSLEWRDGDKIVSWELDGITLIVDCKCVSFEKFMEADDE